LVAELKETESSLDSDIASEDNKRIQIIDAEPNSIFATATIQPEELEDLEEGGGFFHS
jgi:hypothetical protein